LEHQAAHDAMNGLPNRCALLDWLGSDRAAPTGGATGCLRAGAGVPMARDHRVRAGRHRAAAHHTGGDPRTRWSGAHRRLRYRLLLARAASVTPVRRSEDRSVLHRTRGPRPRRRSDRRPLAEERRDRDRGQQAHQQDDHEDADQGGAVRLHAGATRVHTGASSTAVLRGIGIAY